MVSVPGKGKSLWRVAVNVRPEAEDAVTELLTRIFEHPGGVYKDAESNRTTAFVYVPSVSSTRLRAARDALRELSRYGINPGPGRVSVTRVRVENWAESWKRHFKPIEVSSRLLIKPGWSKRRAKRGQAMVVLDPGLSFGTGQHATTAFCLEQISALRMDGTRQSFLDIGTGSGILAISAAALEYSPVEAFDFDPAAVAIATANARRNRVNISVRHRDLMKVSVRSAGRFDLVCANLTADLLIEGCERILNRTASGGTVVLAGILTKQFLRVARAFRAAGARLAATQTGGEWKSGAFRVHRSLRE